MTYDAKQIANWFVERAKTDGKQFSIMSLLKLTYIAHGWYLETRDRPLFANGIEAWRYGPVIPDVYLAFRKQGVTVGDPVNVPANRDLRKEDADFLEEVYGIYGNLTAFQLSELTHVQGGPWDIASKLGGHYAEIPNDLIRQHYVDKRTRAQRVLIMHGSIPKHDPDLGTGHSDPAEPQRNQVSDFEFLGLEYNNKLNRHRLDVRHGQIKDYVFGLSVIVLLYMAVVFFVLFHSFLSNPGRFSNIGFAGAIFVAPIAAITAVMIAMLVGAFRRYSDKDADDFANGAIGLARGMSGGN